MSELRQVKELAPHSTVTKAQAIPPYSTVSALDMSSQLPDEAEPEERTSCRAMIDS